MGRLLKAIPPARTAQCESDYHSTPFHRKFAIQENKEEDRSGAEGEMGKGEGSEGIGLRRCEEIRTRYKGARRPQTLATLEAFPRIVVANVIRVFQHLRRGVQRK
jgi:hypothetical protein